MKASTPEKIANTAYLERLAAGVTTWSQRYFPDAYVFAVLAVLAVSVGALTIGVTPKALAIAFGDGFWTKYFPLPLV